MRNKIGYPDTVARLLGARPSSAATSSATSSRALRFEARRQLAKIGKPVDRGEWRMTAADGERLLRRADERHQLPGRRPAAAALRPEDRRRAELRQHRRHHRPRAHARLRRRGPPVRRRRATCATGGRRRTRESFEKRAQCIRDQYSQYTIVDDIKINGELTSGEDIADLGGTILALDGVAGSRPRPCACAERDGLTPDAALLRRLRAVGLRRTSARRTCA